VAFFRHMLRYGSIGGAALLLTAGCASSTPTPSAATAMPAEDELPPPQRSERYSAASVAVDGRFHGPKLATVPEFEPVEPTPEEREILGPPPPDPLQDLLVFYPIPPGPAQGVAPVGAIATQARNGLPVYPYSTAGSPRGSVAAVDVRALPAQGVLLRPGASSAAQGHWRSPSGQGYSETGGAATGEGEARTKAGRNTRYD
jgi:hypothetical protein